MLHGLIRDALVFPGPQLSAPAQHALDALLRQPDAKPAGLGAASSELRLMIERMRVSLGARVPRTQDVEAVEARLAAITERLA